MFSCTCCTSVLDQAAHGRLCKQIADDPSGVDFDEKMFAAEEKLNEVCRKTCWQAFGCTLC